MMVIFEFHLKEASSEVVVSHQHNDCLTLTL